MTSSLIKILITATLIAAASIALNAQNAPSVAPGKNLYLNNCAKCHGKAGTKKGLGVKKIQTSTMDDAALLDIIRKGKNRMPAWENSLTQAEMEDIIVYIKSLRK